MTGAYSFKRFDPSPEQDHWDVPPGHWTAWDGRVVTAHGPIPRVFVMIRCPLCSTCGTLPHRVDANGCVHPSIVCTGPDTKPGTCPFHTMPNTLEGWDRVERPDTKEA